MINPRTELSTVWRRAALLLALCAVLVSASASSEVHHAIVQLLELARGQIGRHPISGALLFVALAAISSMLTFLSIAAAVPAMVYAWGEPVSLLLLWIGWLLGGVGTYCIGRWLGRPALRWLVTDQTLDQFEERMRHGASFMVVLLLQIALPSEIPGYVLGLVRYPFARYLLALALAELPYTLATVYLGAAFVEQRGELILVTGIALILLSLTAFYSLRRLLRPSHDSQAMTSAEIIAAPPPSGPQ